MSRVLQSSKMEEGIVKEAVTASSASIAKKNEAFSERLSTVSKMRGVDGDVELNEAGLVMLDMNQSGQGNLTNALVQQHKMQKEVLFKTTIFGLIVLVAFLAVSNLGTSFASQELIDAGDIFDATVPSDSGQAARKLSQQCRGNPLVCELTTFGDVPNPDARQIISKCRQGETVVVERQWSATTRVAPPSPIQLTICTPEDCTIALRTTIANGDNPEAHLCDGITLEPNEDGNTYTIAGDDLTQDVSSICYDDSDCDGGLVCGYINEDPPSIPDLPNLEDCDDNGNCGDGYVCVQSNQYPSGKCSICDPAADPNAATNPCSGDTPVCIDNGSGGGYCGCGTDDQCSGLGDGFTCDGPICVPDITKYCYDGNHNHQWGCDVCIPA